MLITLDITDEICFRKRKGVYYPSRKLKEFAKEYNANIAIAVKEVIQFTWVIAPHGADPNEPEMKRAIAAIMPHTVRLENDFAPIIEIDEVMYEILYKLKFG
jgi:hypothetical protein